METVIIIIVCVMTGFAGGIILGYIFGKADGITSMIDASQRR